MKPGIIKGYTRIVGIDQRYVPLPLLDTAMEDGTPCMTAVFKPTAEQIETIVNGGYIQLSILGVQWPPVALDAVKV